MSIEVTPFTDEDRAWVRAKETHGIRDAVLSDPELDAYRAQLERELIASRARRAPDWWPELIAIRLEVIRHEVRYRQKIASLGGPGYLPGDWWHRAVERIRERARTDLVAIMIADGLIVDERRGEHNGELWGICPIHNERSSSMHVNEDDGVWHCFGCGAGGDVFGWLEAAHGLVFRDAVKWLAKHYGIDLTPPPGKLRPLEGQ